MVDNHHHGGWGRLSVANPESDRDSESECDGECNSESECDGKSECDGHGLPIADLRGDPDARVRRHHELAGGRLGADQPQHDDRDHRMVPGE
jgi:hypothetical protein